MMLEPRSPKVWIIAAGSLLVVGAGVWALVIRPGDDNPAGLPKELTASAMKDQASDPGKLMDTMREAMRREDLTEEQRRQIGENMRETMQAMMQERVDEYYNASEDEKNAVLDKHMEEWQARMKEWEQRRKEWEKEREAEGKKPDGPPQGWQRGPGNQSQQERKARSESRNPDQIAKMMGYFGAMQKRATERGIKIPQMGPGRGPGGMGGGGGQGGGGSRPGSGERGP